MATIGSSWVTTSWVSTGGWVANSWAAGVVAAVAAQTTRVGLALGFSLGRSA